MRRGLRRRLEATHVAVAVLAALIVTVVAVSEASHRFDAYLEKVRLGKDGIVMQTLRDTYRAPDGWDATAVYALNRVATAAGVDLAVYLPEGDLLFTIEGHPAGAPGGSGGGSAAGSASSAAGSLHRSDYDVKRHDVVIDGQKVADAEVYVPRLARGAAEKTFQSDLTRDVIIAALAAAALALGLSIIISRRLTVGLEDLTDAAGDIVAGNLAVRVASTGDDEVGTIASALDSMAARLAQDEQWRRDVTSDLSEQLSAPLAAIEARVDAIERSEAPVTKADLRAIGAQVGRLGRSLSALQALNQSGEDLGAPHEPVDLDALAAEVTAACDAEVRAKDLTLETRSEAVVVSAGREHLRQVLTALLDNALTFTPRGGHVVLSASRATTPPPERAAGSPAAEWALLTVADDGPGIDAVDRPFVCDRFYRGRNARGTAGAGLGLAVARELVEMYGGTVTVAEAPGGGTLVSVYLPAVG